MTDDTPKPTGLSPDNSDWLARTAARIPDKPLPKRERKQRNKPADKPSDRKFMAVDATTGETKEYDRISITHAEARAIAPAPRTHKPAVKFSPEIANTILSLMADGLMFTEIALLPDMPSATSMWNWMEENPAFKLGVTRARNMQGEWAAAQVKAIAQNVNAVTFQQDRVKMQAFQWLASKAFPAIYGDRSTVEHTGNVEVVQRHIIDASMLDDSQLEALEGALTAANALPAPQDVDETAD